MKRLLPLIAIMFLLSSCTVKNYTPRIPTSYKCELMVSLGDFSYNGVFCKTESNTAVTVTSTNAKGLEMVYDGELLTMCYKDYAYELDAQHFENTNPAIVLYQVFDSLTLEQTKKTKIDGGYKYEGVIPLGAYVLIQNDDETISSLSFKSIDYNITFSEPMT